MVKAGEIVIGGIAIAVPVGLLIAWKMGWLGPPTPECPPGTGLIWDPVLKVCKCPDGMTWDGTKCVPEIPACVTDADCPAGYKCVGNVCVPIEPMLDVIVRIKEQDVHGNDTGNWVQAAEVRMEGVSQYTDVDGRTYWQVTPGLQTRLNVSKPGYAMIWLLEVEFPTEGEYVFGLRLVPADYVEISAPWVHASGVWVVTILWYNIPTQVIMQVDVALVGVEEQLSLLLSQGRINQAQYDSGKAQMNSYCAQKGLEEWIAGTDHCIGPDLVQDYREADCFVTVDKLKIPNHPPCAGCVSDEDCPYNEMCEGDACVPTNWLTVRFKDIVTGIYITEGKVTILDPTGAWIRYGWLEDDPVEHRAWFKRVDPPRILVNFVKTGYHTIWNHEIAKNMHNTIMVTPI